MEDRVYQGHRYKKCTGKSSKRFKIMADSSSKIHVYICYAFPKQKNSTHVKFWYFVQYVYCFLLLLLYLRYLSFLYLG